MDCKKLKNDDKLRKTAQILTLKVSKTKNRCPIGETVGNQNLAGSKIPVFSCEGSCIRGEIARLAANSIAQEEPYRRGCHGEFFTVPYSAMANWINNSRKVVLIDGCFIRCHGRILEKLLSKKTLIQFDALSYHKKYCDKFDINSVPEEERKHVAESVASWVLSSLKKKNISKEVL